MRFYLGSHMPSWLTFDGVPDLFISHRRLTARRTLPQPAGRWALDSGGFTELSTFGEWRTTPAEYVNACRRYRSEMGGMEWCAAQDWMCEPHILRMTGLSVAEHQRRTIDNYLTLRTLDDSIPFVPVLQGWTVGDYLEHVDAYHAAGVDLENLPTVGVGSVCRRQATNEIGGLIARLSSGGLRLHGFGVKSGGIRAYGWLLDSADSMAWSFRGRNVRPCPHSNRRQSCANCYPFALEWRERCVDAVIDSPAQMAMI